MPTSALEHAPPIRCFLSYAHEDDEVLHVAAALKRSLEYLAYAHRKRRVEVFFDHESIGWGHDWRESIRTNIEGALVFIPLITQSYLPAPNVS